MNFKQNRNARLELKLGEAKLGAAAKSSGIRRYNRKGRRFNIISMGQFILRSNRDQQKLEENSPTLLYLNLTC